MAAEGAVLGGLSDRLILPEDHVIPTDMTVEQGFKLLMSAGIVAPLEPLTISADEAPHRAPPEAK